MLSFDFFIYRIIIHVLSIMVSNIMIGRIIILVNLLAMMNEKGYLKNRKGEMRLRKNIVRITGLNCW